MEYIRVTKDNLEKDQQITLSPVEEEYIKTIRELKNDAKKGSKKKH